MIFAPIIIVVCRRMKIRPAAYLLGMTICINIKYLIEGLQDYK